MKMPTERFEHEITELRLGLPGAGGANANKEPSSDRQKCSDQKNTTIGWPPVCSYRKRSIGSEKECMEANSSKSRHLVKISKDGVPFLRKIDVNDYKDYFALHHAIHNLFSTSSNFGGAQKDTENADYVPIYEDRDGDWLLLGDVPWMMFEESCKRLRIMKRSEAKGFGLQSKKP